MWAAVASGSVAKFEWAEFKSGKEPHGGISRQRYRTGLLRSGLEP